MKLIDLLVKELPSRGGWPEEFTFVVQDANGDVKFGLIPHVMFYNSSKWLCKRGYDAENIWGDNCTPPEMRQYTLTDDYDSAIVTREQYEASVWNGEGLPPVGTEFEYGSHRSVAKCIAVSYHHVFASKGDPDDENGEYEEFLIDIGHSSFRPIRTEAECQRDEAVAKMFYVLPSGLVPGKDIREAIYDAIAAHKITGVTLVPTVSQIVRVTEKCSREDAERIITMLTGGTITE